MVREHEAYVYIRVLGLDVQVLLSVLNIKNSFGFAKEKATLKKKDTGSKKRERMKTGTASLQTAPGQGLNIGGGS